MVNFNLKSPRLVISSRFLFFSNKSFTALNPHSTKYDDGNGNSSFLAKLLVFGYLSCVSSQSYIIYVDIRHWPNQIYYMNVINISTINNYLQSG